MKRRELSSKQFGSVFLGFVLLLLFSISFAITCGNADISIKDVYRVIGYELFRIQRFAEYSSGAIHDVVWLIRFPRVLLACTIGMGLSVCGAVMQAVVKNPLADPYVLGISSGASMGATVAILFGIGASFGENFIGLMAFLGAMFSSFLVLLLANVGRSISTGKLVLVGMAMSAICSSISNFAIYMAHNQNSTSQVLFWTMGSLANAKWEMIQVVLPILFIGTMFFFIQSRTLNLMLFGEETSITLGTNVKHMRIVFIVMTLCMVGFSVYCAGTIGFVGLVIPHAVRIVIGMDHRRLIPLSALVGACFLVWVDVLCRIILKHSELPIGILVSMIGAPCFVYLLFRHSYGFGGKMR